MKSGALLLLCVALHAQPQMEITGKVVEPGTNLGIYDATVLVSRMESRGPTLTRDLSFPVENGAYVSGPLAAGEYRVQVATPQEALDSKVDPKTGQKVTIHAGETTTVNLVAR